MLEGFGLPEIRATLRHSLAGSQTGIGFLPKSEERHALVIGGSMSGLFAASLLARAGWTAAIYERAEAELSGRGAGIVTHAAMRAVLRAVGCDPTRDIGIEVAGRRTLDRSGRVIGHFGCAQTVTSWDRVFRMLRENFPADRYHLGKELLRIAPSAGGVTAHFADGARAEADLIVGADGFRSSVRTQMLPGIEPVYAGYVAWRGLVPESALSPATRADLFDALVFCLPAGEQCLSYPVAGPDNDLRAGHRRCNFVWYRPTPAPELRRMLTDATGRVHALGIPPPLVRDEVIAELRAAARALLPPQLEEVIRLTARPFLQPIYDVETPHMAVGRIALLGDAAFLARPHVAAGVTKAAEDAMALATALQSNGGVESALQRFAAARIGINRQVMERGRDLGSYLQPQLTSAKERRKAERHRTPQAVMSEIAVLDFLRA
jgi:2-polyprenyl-6-methoxyphenol hydroxylase-like FAD-dependent oxidoreductase